MIFGKNIVVVTEVTSNVPSKLRMQGVTTNARKNGISTLCICKDTDEGEEKIVGIQTT